jgi:hypothetical protein
LNLHILKGLVFLLSFGSFIILEVTKKSVN